MLLLPILFSFFPRWITAPSFLRWRAQWLAALCLAASHTPGTGNDSSSKVTPSPSHVLTLAEAVSITVSILRYGLFASFYHSYSSRKYCYRQLPQYLHLGIVIRRHPDREHRPCRRGLDLTRLITVSAIF